jgi:hypothetical protein
MPPSKDDGLAKLEAAAEAGRTARKVARKRWLKTPKGRAYRKARAQRNRQHKKLAVFAHYGGDPPRCACCEEANAMFLVLDHIHGGGKAHRKALLGLTRNGRPRTSGFYRALVRDGFPAGIRVLCANCNMAMTPGARRCRGHRKSVAR